MTENQLRYLAHQENVRHNLAAEGLQSGSLDEAIRSNTAREQETARSNLVNEGLRERQFLEQLIMDQDTRRTNAINRTKSQADTAKSIAQAFESGTKAADTLTDIFGIDLEGIADLIDAVVPM